ncbi:MAG: hypothetical protein RR385_09005 [Clostridiales bacterium]
MYEKSTLEFTDDNREIYKPVDMSILKDVSILNDLGLPKTACTVLIRQDGVSLEILRKMDKNKLKKLNGVGYKTYKEICLALERYEEVLQVKEQFKKGFTANIGNSPQEQSDDLKMLCAAWEQLRAMIIEYNIPSMTKLKNIFGDNFESWLFYLDSTLAKLHRFQERLSLDLFLLELEDWELNTKTSLHKSIVQCYAELKNLTKGK